MTTDVEARIAIERAKARNEALEEAAAEMELTRDAAIAIGNKDWALAFAQAARICRFHKDGQE